MRQLLAGIAALAFAAPPRAEVAFFPIPEIDTAPHSGVTLGVIPTFLTINADQKVDRIVAPDVIHSQYFGWGSRARVFAFPSADTEWSLIAGMKQHVEREFDARYASGLTRAGRYSWSAEAIYDRSGVTRFYGLGNQTRRADETAYVDEQSRIEAALGVNFSHALQLSYMTRLAYVDVQRGAIPGVPSIEPRYAGVPGVGRERELQQRVVLARDTRDSAVIPHQGGRLAVYGGFAAHGLGGDAAYAYVGGEARYYWPVGTAATFAAHGSLRYMPPSAHAPFWALSSLGGERSVLAEREPLRAYGDDRFIDRNRSAAGIELRMRIAEFEAFSTHLGLEIAPFVDAGKVYARVGESPFSRLHTAWGVGFRGLASPSVVGYVDIGFGRERAAVFSGINYPF